MEIEKAFKKLLIQQPFYGLFSLSLPKTITTEIPTLAVAKKGLYPELLINPEFWAEHTDEEQVALLQHELSHIALQHMFMSEFFPNARQFNIAADLEVNSYIDNLPKSGLRAKQFNLEDGKGAKYYYEHIPEQPEQGQDPQQGQGQPQFGEGQGDHSKWKDFKNLPEAAKQLIQSNINTMLKNTAEQINKQRGTIPGELTEIIEKLTKPKPEIFNWKAYFRRMLGSIYDINIKLTRKKPSKRFDGSAGIKHKKKVSILVAVDTSGSVNDHELQDFFSEINHIHRAGGRVTIIQCDTQITQVSEYDGINIPKITGRGGTDFQPPIDYYLEHKHEYEALIYFTDGFAPVPTNAPNGMIWIITSQGNKNDVFPGKVIHIPAENS